ncbi:hypothetical protein OC539_15595 [Paracoccus denitrificans]|jgi:hypothetical protein|nr:hypothetical protein [Paracoccus denitrificans]MBB4628867.1 hypothetical protein [Paracoccus denitrificans]MCU7429753.1 hypothetical protein [Paracoccus denitrificans]UPV94406.1 hypothetical protein M0K93_11220 [Paracoccus denitrificans]
MKLAAPLARLGLAAAWRSFPGLGAADDTAGCRALDFSGFPFLEHGSRQSIGFRDFAPKTPSPRVRVMVHYAGRENPTQGLRHPCDRPGCGIEPAAALPILDSGTTAAGALGKLTLLEPSGLSPGGKLGAGMVDLDGLLH